MIIECNKEFFHELEVCSIKLIPTTIDETYHYNPMLEIYTEFLISMTKNNNFILKLFISNGAYNTLDKYYQKNKVQKYLDKKYKLWGIPNIKSYWNGVTSHEQEIYLDNETTIYADIIDISVENIQKSLNWCLEKFGYISLLETHSFIFLVPSDINSNNLTVKNIVQNMLHTRCPEYHSSKYCFSLKQLVSFFNENNAYPIFLFENHGTQIDFSLHIFDSNKVLTLEDNFDDYK